MSESKQREGGGNPMGTWKVKYEYGQHMVHDDAGRLVMATHDRRVALLGAAAPKLLAACERLVKWDDDENMPIGKHVNELAGAVDDARAAIREARGEAE